MRPISQWIKRWGKTMQTKSIYTFPQSQQSSIIFFCFVSERSKCSGWYHKVKITWKRRPLSLLALALVAWLLVRFLLA